MRDCLPAGQYWIGDLCYVLHQEWDEACELFFAGRTDHGCNQGLLKFADGREFVSYNTRYGDGTYTDNQGREYPVDAGMIGIIKLSGIDINYPTNNIDLGHIVEFLDPFVVDCVDGVMQFGHIIIDTANDPIDDEDYQNEEE